MFLGKLIAWSAMRENKFVTFLPAYGAEVRGGTSNCSIVISDKEIASPCVDAFDSLIAMNDPSLEKFSPLAGKSADIFVNSSMVNDFGSRVSGFKKRSDIHLQSIPFTDIALKLGNVRAANMVALGAYLAKKNILSVENIIAMLPEAFKNNQKLVQLNEKAIKEGLKYGKGSFRP